MKLKEYLEKNKISALKFSFSCGTDAAAIYAIVKGIRRPQQALAERIEKATNGEVKVVELRGKDERIIEGIKKQKADYLRSRDSIRKALKAVDILGD